MIVLVKGESIGPFHLISAPPPPRIEGHGYPGGVAFKNAIPKGDTMQSQVKHMGVWESNRFFTNDIMDILRGESKTLQ